MSTITKEQVVEALGNMSVMQLIDLTKTLEEQWGVKAAPVIGWPTDATAPPPATDQATEQTEFDVILTHVEPDKMIAAIKLVREVAGLGLKEAKDIIEHLASTPHTIKSAVNKAEAEELKAKFTAVGVTVTLK